MFGLLKKLLSSKSTDNGKSLKKVVNELQHTHDLQEVIELLNDLYGNLEKNDSPMTTVVQLEPTEPSKVKFEGDMNASIVAAARFMNCGSVVPYEKITSSKNIEYIIGLLFDLDCYGHSLFKVVLDDTPDGSRKQIILIVR